MIEYTVHICTINVYACKYCTHTLWCYFVSILDKQTINTLCFFTIATDQGKGGVTVFISYFGKGEERSIERKRCPTSKGNYVPIKLLIVINQLITGQYTRFTKNFGWSSHSKGNWSHSQSITKYTFQLDNSTTCTCQTLCHVTLLLVVFMGMYVHVYTCMIFL